MNLEQKIKLINLVQEYFKDKDPEEIEMYGNTIPNYELLDIFSLVLFNKSSTVCSGYDRTVHRYCYTENLSPEEKRQINEEYRCLLNAGVLSKTKTGKATKVSEKIINYNTER